MAESVREQLASAWEARVGLIAPPTYLSSLDYVTRWSLPIVAQEGRVGVILRQGAERPNPEGDTFGKRHRILTMQNVFQVRHDATDEGLSTETVLNRLEQDLYHVIALDPQLGGLCQGAEWIGTDAPEILEDGGMVQQVIQYDIHYRHKDADETSL